MRILAAPLILLVAALSFPRLEKWRREHCYGWLSPDMEPHWYRLAHGRGSFNHIAKNVLVEWVRLDPQRAGKLFAFLLCISVFLNLVLAWKP